ncbi:STAS domain-containing protein [Actinomycetes bacterium KLBMP 9797]
MTTLTAPMVRRSPSTVGLTPHGEIDLASRGVLNDAIMAALSADPPPAALVVDLADVGFCDCSGVRVLLRGRAAARAAGIDFRVVNAHGVVLRVLRTLGVERELAA